MKIKDLFNINEKMLKDPKSKYKISIANLDHNGCITAESEIFVVKIGIDSDKHMNIVRKMASSIELHSI